MNNKEIEELEKELDWYNGILAKVQNENFELFKENLQLKEDKEKAVKACRKYREINKKLLEENALLHNNVDAIIHTYNESNNALAQVVQSNQYMAGQLKVYKEFYNENEDENNESKA